MCVFRVVLCPALHPLFCPLCSPSQAIRLSLEQALPPEPTQEKGEPISKLRIRTPSGEFLERRFLGSCKLQVLFDFVASKGYPFEEFKLLTTFPRKNVRRTAVRLARNTNTLLHTHPHDGAVGGVRGV